MTIAADEKPGSEGSDNHLRKVAELLGGPRILSRRTTSSLEAHELLLHGLPATALNHLLRRLIVMRKTASLEKAVGIRLRGFQRPKDADAKLLSQHQSGQTWKFAEILVKATDVFGSQGEAERWLERPAIGLDQYRPIDLLATSAGIDCVEQYLERLSFGVYT